MIDEKFWVALSFVIVIAFLYKPVKKLLSKTLRKKAEEIKTSFETSEKLREESEKVLKSYNEMRKEVITESEKIIFHTEERIAKMIEEAKKNLEISLEKKKNFSMQKIASYEKSIINNLREESVNLAIQVVQKLLKERLLKKASDPLLLDSIYEIKRKLH